MQFSIEHVTLFFFQIHFAKKAWPKKILEEKRPQKKAHEIGEIFLSKVDLYHTLKRGNCYRYQKKKRRGEIVRKSSDNFASLKFPQPKSPTFHFVVFFAAFCVNFSEGHRKFTFPCNRLTLIFRIIIVIFCTHLLIIYHVYYKMLDLYSRDIFLQKQDPQFSIFFP